MRERDKGILILLGKAVGWGDRVALMVSEIVTGVRDGRCRKRDILAQGKVIRYRDKIV